MIVNIKQVDEKSTIPQHQTAGAAGFDLASCEDILILPGQVVAVNTGLAFEIPTGYVMQLISRSGLALKKNIFILNAPGIIDNDFRGEVKAIICNASNVNFGIRVGDRICQAVLSSYETFEPNILTELTETERGDGGFGSSGS